MGNRHKARELALQILFGLDFNDVDAVVFLYNFWKSTYVSDEILTFCEERVLGVVEHRDQIDALITKYSDNWRLDRMTAVDRNVLRMAVYEILHCADIPKNVLINEAVEIGKHFGSEDSGSFVNGVLDKIADDQRIAGEEEEKS